MKKDNSISDILENLDTEVNVDKDIKETKMQEFKESEEISTPYENTSASNNQNEEQPIPDKPNNKKPKSQARKIIDFALIGIIVISLSFAAYSAWNIIDTKQKESVSLSTAEQNAKNKSFSTGPFKVGDVVGLITIEEAQIKTAMVFGGESGNAEQLDESMKKGAAIDNKSPMIGDQKQSIVYGHRNQEFLKLERVKPGTKVKVETAAGVFNFKVNETKVVNETQTQGIDLYDYNRKTEAMPTYDKEQMILYTCYPFNLAAATNERFLVYTELESKE